MMRQILKLFIVAFLAYSNICANPEQNAAHSPRIHLPDESYGSDAAPIHIIMFYSVDCGHCKLFRKEDLPTIIERFVKPGWVKFTIQDFPIHPNSLKALQLARCGNGKCYNKVIDALFEHQENLFFKFDPKVGMEKDLEDKLIQIGQAHGLSVPECQSCLKNQELSDAILSKRLEAQIRYNIDFTPAFIVNGRLLKEEEDQVTVKYIENLVKECQAKGIFPSRS